MLRPAAGVVVADHRPASEVIEAIADGRLRPDALISDADAHLKILLHPDGSAQAGVVGLGTSQGPTATAARRTTVGSPHRVVRSGSQPRRAATAFSMRRRRVSGFFALSMARTCSRLRPGGSAS